MIAIAYIAILALAGCLIYIVIVGLTATQEEGNQHGTDKPGPDQT